MLFFLIVISNFKGYYLMSVRPRINCKMSHGYVERGNKIMCMLMEHLCMAIFFAI